MEYGLSLCSMIRVTWRCWPEEVFLRKRKITSEKNSLSSLLTKEVFGKEMDAKSIIERTCLGSISLQKSMAKALSDIIALKKRSCGVSGRLDIKKEYYECCSEQR